MRKNKKLHGNNISLWLVGISVLLVFGLFLAWGFSSFEINPAGEKVTNQSIYADVTFVADGDTFFIEGNQKVRLIGVDAPESGESYYNEAKQALFELVQGKRVTLVPDISETDKYGRLLRYVYVNGVSVNETLLRLGVVRTLSISPDISFSNKFYKIEQEAKKSGIGMWKEIVN